MSSPISLSFSPDKLIEWIKQICQEASLPCPEIQSAFLLPEMSESQAFSLAVNVWNSIPVKTEEEIIRKNHPKVFFAAALLALRFRDEKANVVVGVPSLAKQLLSDWIDNLNELISSTLPELSTQIDSPLNHRQVESHLVNFGQSIRRNLWPSSWKAEDSASKNQVSSLVHDLVKINNQVVLNQLLLQELFHPDEFYLDRVVSKSSVRVSPSSSFENPLTTEPFPLETWIPLPAWVVSFFLSFLVPLEDSKPLEWQQYLSTGVMRHPYLHGPLNAYPHLSKFVFVLFGPFVRRLIMPHHVRNEQLVTILAHFTNLEELCLAHALLISPEVVRGLSHSCLRQIKLTHTALCASDFPSSNFPSLQEVVDGERPLKIMALKRPLTPSDYYLLHAFLFPDEEDDDHRPLWIECPIPHLEFLCLPLDVAVAPLEEQLTVVFRVLRVLEDQLVTLPSALASSRDLIEQFATDCFHKFWVRVMPRFPTDLLHDALLQLMLRLCTGGKEPQSVFAQKFFTLITLKLWGCFSCLSATHSQPIDAAHLRRLRLLISRFYPQIHWTNPAEMIAELAKFIKVLMDRLMSQQQGDVQFSQSDSPPSLRALFVLGDLVVELSYCLPGVFGQPAARQPQIFPVDQFCDFLSNPATVTKIVRNNPLDCNPALLLFAAFMESSTRQVLRAPPLLHFAYSYILSCAMVTNLTFDSREKMLTRILDQVKKSPPSSYPYLDLHFVIFGRHAGPHLKFLPEDTNSPLKQRLSEWNGLFHEEHLTEGLKKDWWDALSNGGSTLGGSPDPVGLPLVVAEFAKFRLIFASPHSVPCLNKQDPWFVLSRQLLNDWASVSSSPFRASAQQVIQDNPNLQLSSHAFISSCPF